MADELITQLYEDDLLYTQDYLLLYRLLMINNRVHKESHMLPDSGLIKLPEEAATPNQHRSLWEDVSMSRLTHD